MYNVLTHCLFITFLMLLLHATVYSVSSAIPDEALMKLMILYWNKI